MTWKCPQCGEVNKETVLLCGLCGERRPEEKPVQVVARVMGAPTAPPPVQASPPPFVPGQGWNAPSPTANLSPEERNRLAAEAAAQIMGQTPKPMVNSGSCMTMTAFICLLPWSLIILPMPGGVKNKNAGKVLGIIFGVCVVLGIISLIVGIGVFGPTISKLMLQLKNGYNVPDG